MASKGISVTLQRAQLPSKRPANLAANIRQHRSYCNIGKTSILEQVIRARMVKLRQYKVRSTKAMDVQNVLRVFYLSPSLLSATGVRFHHNSLVLVFPVHILYYHLTSRLSVPRA